MDSNIFRLSGGLRPPPGLRLYTLLGFRLYSGTWLFTASQNSSDIVHDLYAAFPIIPHHHGHFTIPALLLDRLLISFLSCFAI
jgi:hypothetical protein